jgi:TonB family protein
MRRILLVTALTLLMSAPAFPQTSGAQQAPATTAAEAFRVSRWVRPYYPQDAKDHGVAGDVDVEMSVGPDGMLLSARAVSGPDVLRADAERAARLWRFERRPDGRAPAGPLSLRVTFSFTEEYGHHYATLALSSTLPPLTTPVTLYEAEQEDARAKGVPEPASTPVPSTGPGAPGGGIGSGEGAGTEGGAGGGIGAGQGSGTAPAQERPKPKPIATKAKILSSPRPGYTDQARQNRTTGTIRVRVFLGADGTIKYVRVFGGLPDGLNAKAMEAIHKIKFEPARDVDGNAVDSWVSMNLSFYFH